MSDAVVLQGLTPARLQAAFPSLRLDEARRIVGHVHRGLSPGVSPGLSIDRPVPQVRRVALDEVRRGAVLGALRVVETAASAVDPFCKLLLEAPDGKQFEAVRIPLEKPGCFSVCVSSQAGCALGCTFCATGRLGLERNLEAWEIVEQVRAVKRTLGDGQRVTGVVFQGMGEPLANLDRVLQALAVLSEPAALAIDARRITVCTSGLPSGILRLASEAPNVRLGWSVGSFDEARRQRLMPIGRAHPLPEVLDAIAAHATQTRQSPLWALTLLAGHNDDVAEAERVVEAARAFTTRTGRRPRLSVIPYNSLGPDDPYQRSDEATTRRFLDVLHAGGFPGQLRYSGGGDVAAACGQLRRHTAGDALPLASPGFVALTASLLAPRG